MQAKPVYLARQTPKPKEMLYDWSNHTVLIAEDDEMNYKYLEMIFSRFTNINIIWAINGMMAVDYCSIYSHIDLVIMDIQLPVIDGFEAARQIRKLKPEIPLIAHSASHPGEISANSDNPRFDDYIPKPSNYHELLSRLDEVLHAAAGKSKIRLTGQETGSC